MKTTIIESGYQTVWQSPVLNNGEFDYRLSVQVTNVTEATGDVHAGYDVSVYVSKCFSSLSPDQQKAIIETVGDNDTQPIDHDVLEYGYCARIDSAVSDEPITKNKANKHRIEFVKKFLQYESMLGFYLDKPQNRIGNDGWDFLDGKIG